MVPFVLVGCRYPDATVPFILKPYNVPGLEETTLDIISHHNTIASIQDCCMEEEKRKHILSLVLDDLLIPTTLIRDIVAPYLSYLYEPKDILSHPHILVK